MVGGVFYFDSRYTAVSFEAAFEGYKWLLV